MYVLSLGRACPKVLAATHFHDIFHEDLLPLSLPISFLHMQILLTSSSGELLEPEMEESEAGRVIQPGETITYLYR